MRKVSASLWRRSLWLSLQFYFGAFGKFRIAFRTLRELARAEIVRESENLIFLNYCYQLFKQKGNARAENERNWRIEHNEFSSVYNTVRALQRFCCHTSAECYCTLNAQPYRTDFCSCKIRSFVRVRLTFGPILTAGALMIQGLFAGSLHIKTLGPIWRLSFLSLRKTFWQVQLIEINHSTKTDE